ncbi:MULTISPECIES: hypothetical protein [unclassified Tolypothrix]|uniref:hypothetical protein n=1 Tax=unclassified Tolypothrix TaxID=2649714 RepID=UPI0005EAB837|nr:MULTISPECIES: hypothetical protein [unclassified Tolypothrix]BAY88734.1 hypothetical protein NIES3275_07340 [Microchaete diplosiphon NIES-3275]EKF01613.1 hypothetical protein FDUTEX481_07770 [Tolypothrix sp. PCC 7601]MBE9085850.1 hypothetical protein [Tolypothrix sp. LEGE 11397]UYD29395.1 hypothetical protein HGR01_16045 [Tolypothrix sp. PCC 7712]UYD34698.1 hypothetical protein HG267_02285 [Tolypothrix sp. PCC 7601]
MHSVNIFCHEFVVAVSFVACIVGLFLLGDGKQQKDEMEETEQILLRMSFSYWLVYCIAFGVEKVMVPSWEPMLMTLKITTALSYFLTFSCILSLPLHRFAVHQVEE